MHRKIFGEMSVTVTIISRGFVNTSGVFFFLVEPYVRDQHRSPPEHAVFIASTAPDILALVGPWHYGYTAIIKCSTLSERGSTLDVII